MSIPPVCGRCHGRKRRRLYGAFRTLMLPHMRLSRVPCLVMALDFFIITFFLNKLLVSNLVGPLQNWFIRNP